jgi:acid stress-induced BolA-like protein IbaG/YrbA
MHPDEIKTLIESNLANSIVTVTGDGRHFDALVIAPSFQGKSLLARQREVYRTLGDNINNGTIHALSIKAKTPDEWKEENK